jgi:hypothetical protein
MGRNFAMLILLLASSATFSQTTLSFCAGVDKDYCFFNNTQFITEKDSTKALIFMMVKNPYGFNTSALYFDIYSIEKEGRETFETRITLNAGNDWTWAWQPYKFSTPGRYRVTVLNIQQQPLATKQFELFLPK